MDLRNFAPPQVQAGAWLAENAVKLAIGAAVALLVGFTVWKSFFADTAAKNKTAVVQAAADAATSNAGAGAGKDAIPIINNNYYGARASDARSQENRNAILQAPGASAPVDPDLARLVRERICLRPSAASLAGCREMLGVRPGGVGE